MTSVTIVGLTQENTPRKYVVTDGKVIYGLGNTPDEAQKEADRYCAIKCREPFDDVPRLHIPETIRDAVREGQVFMARCSERLAKSTKEASHISILINPKGVLCLEREMPPPGKKKGSKAKHKVKG